MDYSIESIPKDDHHNCWDQHYLATNWFEAWWARFDLWFSLGRSGRRERKTRVRPLPVLFSGKAR